MFKPLEALLAAAIGLAGVPVAWADQDYGLGRAPTHQEIAGWDIDVRPDGQGLPRAAPRRPMARRSISSAAPPATANSARARAATRS